MAYKITVCALFLLGLGACTGPSLYSPLPQSGFATPNSDVVPLGHVRATVTRTYVSPFQNPVFGDATMRREAYQQALKGSDGDLIIDGDFTVRSTVIPIGLMFVNVEGTVEGTAVKIATVGYRPKTASPEN
jgi:hypothetical protein